jgi:hypothetical protein
MGYFGPFKFELRDNICNTKQKESLKIIRLSKVSMRGAGRYYLLLDYNTALHTCQSNADSKCSE